MVDRKLKKRRGKQLTSDGRNERKNGNNGRETQKTTYRRGGGGLNQKKKRVPTKRRNGAFPRRHSGNNPQGQPAKGGKGRLAGPCPKTQTAKESGKKKITKNNPGRKAFFSGGKKNRKRGECRALSVTSIKG